LDFQTFKHRTRDDLYAELASHVDNFVKSGDAKKLVVAVEEIGETATRLQRLRENFNSEQQRLSEGMRLATDIRVHLSMHFFERQLKQLNMLSDTLET
jgi:N-acetylglucosamine kinase-like BadF-type ATPase